MIHGYGTAVTKYVNFVKKKYQSKLYYEGVIIHNCIGLLFFLLGGGLSNLGSISSFSKGFLQLSKPGNKPVDNWRMLMRETQR